MTPLQPATPEDLAACLRESGDAGKRVRLGGRFTKNAYGGPLEEADVVISTRALDSVGQYEPRDLTISVDAGLAWTRLEELLAQNHQMLPLDPPHYSDATVGGVVAANLSGPRRLFYGSARDMIIGMTFATLEGKLVKAGGMVVKNVAGLDMAKLMIGSFGTLAAIASVNFRLFPAPPETRTYLLESPDLAGILEIRDRILNGPLPLQAMDLLNPAASARVECGNYVLAMRAAGSHAVLERYQREFQDGQESRGPSDAHFWEVVRDAVPMHLKEHPAGAVVRVSVPRSQLNEVLGALPEGAVCRAANGVCYGLFDHSETAGEWVAAHAEKGWKIVVEAAPDDRKPALPLWPAAGRYGGMDAQGEAHVRRRKPVESREALWRHLAVLRRYSLRCSRGGRKAPRPRSIWTAASTAACA